MRYMTTDSIQPSNKWDIKRGIPLQLSFLLEANSAEHKVFENLAIQVKNILTKWEFEEENSRYEELRVKNLSAWKRKLEEENHEISKVTKEKISQLRK